MTHPDDDIPIPPEPDSRTKQLSTPSVLDVAIKGGNLAIKGGVKAVSTARGALRSKAAKRIRGGLRSVVGGLVGMRRLMRGNSLRSLLGGELVISERSLNAWFKRVEPPEGVTKMRLACKPSRLVLEMQFERRVMGLALARAEVELPFEVMDVTIDHDGGIVVLRLDRDASQASDGGVLRPLFMRLLHRAASDLLDHETQLDTIDQSSDVITREGDRLIIDVGAHPAFVELMNRELRLLGGRSLFPFRAISVSDVRVKDGQMIVHTGFEPGGWGDSRRIVESLEAHDDLEVEIV